MSKNEDGKQRYLDGVEDYIAALEDDVEDGAEIDESEVREFGMESPQANDYRRAISQRAEWKLRRKQEKPKATTKNRPAKIPSGSTTPRPRAEHGKAPQAPQGYEYYWYSPKPKKGAWL